MRAHHTQSTWNTYPCPDCTTSLPTLATLQNHYQTHHDPDWTAGYPSNCHQCGTTHKRNDRYDYKRAERHFCLDPCFRTWQREHDDLSRNNPNTNTENPAQSKCAHCGTPLTREQSKLDRGDTPRNYCNNKCQGQYRAEHCTGENHPDWKGGTSIYTAVSTLLADKPWEQISENARNKQPECEMCGKPDGNGRGRQNHSHHIVPILAGGTHDEELLMTLCPSCHATVEHYIEDLTGMERVLIPEEHRTTSTDTTENASTESIDADD